jgi:hypothetical protein
MSPFLLRLSSSHSLTGPLHDRVNCTTVVVVDPATVPEVAVQENAAVAVDDSTWATAVTASAVALQKKGAVAVVDGPAMATAVTVPADVSQEKGAVPIV